MARENSFSGEDLSKFEFTKPEEFCFSVEMFEDVPIVTICPIDFFKKNGYLDDQYHSEIGEFLQKNGFTPVLESSYEPDDEMMTAEETATKFLKLGFKQEPEFDKYISETDAHFSVEDFMKTGFEDDGYIEVSDEDDDVEILEDSTVNDIPSKEA